MGTLPEQLPEFSEKCQNLPIDFTYKWKYLINDGIRENHGGIISRQNTPPLSSAEYSVFHYIRSLTNGNPDLYFLRTLKNKLNILGFSAILIKNQALLIFNFCFKLSKLQ